MLLQLTRCFLLHSNYTALQQLQFLEIVQTMSVFIAVKSLWCEQFCVSVVTATLGRKIQLNDKLDRQHGHFRTMQP